MYMSVGSIKLMSHKIIFFKKVVEKRLREKIVVGKSI